MSAMTNSHGEERAVVRNDHLPRRPGIARIALVAAAALVACGNPAPPLAITGTGSIEGLVFFDESEDGVFDPSDGDFVISGVGIAIRNRGTAETFPNGATQSDANGRFLVQSVPLGTHDMFVDTLTVPADVNICQNPLRVSVFMNETRFTNVQGRPGCLITIAEAKDLALGAFVVVRGVVTSSPNQIENDWSYIQDATAGTRIISSSLDGLGIAVGDQIEVGATSGAFSNDFELTSAILRELVPDFDDPQPLVVTTGALAASGASFTDPVQGAFVRVERAQLTGAFGSLGNSQNAPIDDGSGGAIVRVDDGVADRNQLNTLFTVGNCYNMNGFGANFNGAGQIFPRSLADVEEVPCN